jgi:hypothetical protein
MRVKAVAVAVAVAVVAAVGLIALNSRPTQAADQPPAQVSAPASRYQLVVGQAGTPAYLFDTATGRVFQPFFTDKVGEWHEHIVPPKAR